jgi:hypothetical protein
VASSFNSQDPGKRKRLASIYRRDAARERILDRRNADPVSDPAVQRYFVGKRLSTPLNLADAGRVSLVGRRNLGERVFAPGSSVLDSQRVERGAGVLDSRRPPPAKLREPNADGSLPTARLLLPIADFIRRLPRVPARADGRAWSLECGLLGRCG